MSNYFLKVISGLKINKYILLFEVKKKLFSKSLVKISQKNLVKNKGYI